MESGPLRFATFLAPNMLRVYRYIAGYVGRHLERPVELLVGSSFEQFGSGEVDLGFICGLPYVELAARPEPPGELLAAPVLQGARYRNRAVYYSDVIVRRDSAYRSFADLRGTTWAYNEPGSHSGYNITRYHLLTLGETAGYFGRVLAAGSHQHAIRMVHRGQADASAIDSQVLAVELRDHPHLARQLRIVEVLGPATIQPVVAARRLPQAVKAAARDALLAVGADPAARRHLDHGFVSHFTPIADADYDDIRAMVAAAEDTGFTVLA